MSDNSAEAGTESDIPTGAGTMSEFINHHEVADDGEPPRVARVVVKILHQGVPARVKYVGQWWYHTGRVGAIGEENHLVAEYSTDVAHAYNPVAEGPDRVWYDGEGRFYPNPLLEMPAPQVAESGAP